MTSLSEVLQSFSAIVITGGSSGIGKSFIERGQKLNPGAVFCNLSRRLPEKFCAAAAGQRLNHFPCDVSRPAELERIASEVGDFLHRHVPTGQVLLINNSGFGAYGHFPEPNLPRQLDMIDVNVRAVVHLTGLLLPMLKARGGAIVTIASTAAFQPTAFAATYGATKAFVLHWTLALNEELRGTAVRALAVCPGPTESDFFTAAGLKPGSVAGSLTMTSEAVVDATFQALARSRAQVVPGWKNKVYSFVGARVSKPFAARIGANVLARFRVRSLQR